MQQLPQGLWTGMGDGPVVIGDVRVKTRFFKHRGDSSQLVVYYDDFVILKE